jgi:aconitase A
MSPRYMGGFAVIAKSMARIHETVSIGLLAVRGEIGLNPAYLGRRT